MTASGRPVRGAAHGDGTIPGPRRRAGRVRISLRSQRSLAALRRSRAGVAGTLLVPLAALHRCVAVLGCGEVAEESSGRHNWTPETKRTDLGGHR
jgi:hypothetical protein